MNIQSLHRCRLLRAGSLALALAACTFVPFTGATEQLTNPSFDTPGGVGWTKAADWTSDPFSTTGQVSLSLGGWYGTLIWQTLDIGNVGGISGTAGVRLYKNSAFDGNTIAVYLDYLDNANAPQRLLLLNPSNADVVPPDVAFFSAPFTMPANAQRITGFSVDKTASGSFYALEFSLDLEMVPPPVVTLTSPSEGATFLSGVSIPLAATVDTSGASITSVRFYDGTTLITTGQPSLNGAWVFPDGSYLVMIGDYVEAYYDVPNERMYWSTSGSFTSPLAWDGTLYCAQSDIEFPGGIDFSFGSDNTLTAKIHDSVPTELDILIGGVGGGFSWTNATPGTHVLTARAYYGGGQYVTSAAVNITVDAAPRIGVEQPAGTALTSGASTIDFGPSVTGVAVPLTFTLKNTGLAALSGIAVTKAGDNADDYVLTTAPAGSVADGGSTTFTVTFTPAATDTRVASLSIASNDTTNTPFTINLTGSGLALPSLSVTDPPEAATFASGATIPLAAQVANSGAGVTGVKFYDNDMTLIGDGQISISGGWSFPDGSHVGVMGDPAMGVGGVDYSPPFSSGEQMYMTNGTFTTPLAFSGNFTHFQAEGDPLHGAVSITFSWGANHTLQALISGNSPLGTRTLSGGVCDNPKYTLSWTNAPAGTHALTVRAYYGTGQYVPSEPVNITVSAASGFGDWVTQSGIPQGRRGLMDGNGPLDMQNLTAYAMGLNPLLAVPGDLPQVASLNTVAGTLHFIYRRAKNLSDASLTPRFSTDLQTWSNATVLSQSVVGGGSGWDRIDALIGFTPNSPVFLKLAAQTIP